jgi:PII-like signaling protein
MGFGASNHNRSDRLLELSSDLPIVVECLRLAD